MRTARILPCITSTGAVSDFQNVPSIARVAAGAFGFLTLIQVFDGPERKGAQYRLRGRGLALFRDRNHTVGRQSHSCRSLYQVSARRLYQECQAVSWSRGHWCSKTKAMPD